MKYTINWAKGFIEWHLPKELDGVTFLAAGDICLTSEGLKKKVVTTKDPAFLFGPTRSIFESADIVLGNLENPLSERGEPIFKLGPNFRASPNMAKVLSDANFTILGVANNHIRDYGDNAFLDTLVCLQSSGILPVGGGRSASSALEPVIVKRRDLSIGMFAFTYRQESIAQKKRPGAADLDNPNCYEAVRALCDEVDMVIVSLHMDPEYTNYPAPYRMKMARTFVDLGAELVIGHHPHVPQGLEIYKGRLIAYSLGNFIFYPLAEYGARLTRYGYLLKVKLTIEGLAWAEIIPYRINDCYQPKPLQRKGYVETLNHLESISRDLHNPKIVRLAWEEVASKEAMSISKHILHSILKRKTFSLWSCHLRRLRHHYPVFMKNLVEGKLWKHVKNWMQSARARNELSRIMENP